MMKWTPSTTVLAILGIVLLVLLLRQTMMVEGYDPSLAIDTPLAPGDTPLPYAKRLPFFIDLKHKDNAGIFFTFTENSGKQHKQFPYIHHVFKDSYSTMLRNSMDPVDYGTYLLAYYVVKYRKTSVDKRDLVEWLDRFINGFEAPHPINPPIRRRTDMMYIRDQLKRNFREVSMGTTAADKRIKTRNALDPSLAGYPKMKNNEKLVSM